MKMGFNRKKGLEHLEYVVMHIYQYQSFCFFLTMEDVDVEIANKRKLNRKHLEVTVSMPLVMDPKAFVARWEEWQEEELLFDYAILN